MPPTPSGARRSVGHLDPGLEHELARGRTLADQAFSRASGAPLVPGNSVRILKDAAENYPAWLEAIAAARRTIHFESYIIHEDAAGHRFAEALASKAREGVRVRLLYDWLGALGHASRRFWRGLRRAGVEVRCFNPPRLDSPFGWLSRDHRKMIAVDQRVGFVTGLCVGQRWVGDPARGIEPWRDTGVEIRGPAVADLERAFAETWALCGDAIPPGELATRDSIPAAGDVMLRVIASAPTSADLYRLDQLIAAGARRSLWLTDAYFAGLTPYVRALCAAAQDGVDVRLLVPGASDIWLMRTLSRASYRSLLDSGIRVFEWDGPMLHAKSGVADGRWARVGSTNLNVASWIGNWELDVAVEDARFAQAMEAMYREDLRHATEIVLTAQQRVRPIGMSSRDGRHDSHEGSARRVAAGALGIGRAVGAAVTDHRVLGPAEAKLMASAGATLLVVAALAAWWPWLVAAPLAGLGGWMALALLLRAWRLKLRASPRRGEPTSLRGSDPAGGAAGE